MGIQDKNTNNKIKSKNYPANNILTFIDWCIVTKPSVPCSGWAVSGQWVEEHIRKDVYRLNSKVASTTNIQIEFS